MAVVRGGITVKPHVQAFADACSAATGADSFGTYPGHSPPEGPTQALDIFNPETEKGYRLQDAIADFAIKNQKRFGVRYVIKWNPAGKDFIWNIERAAEGWRAMATRDHSDHVHITFYATGSSTPTPPPKEAPDMYIARHIKGSSPDLPWIIGAGIKAQVSPATAEELIRGGVPVLPDLSSGVGSDLIDLGARIRDIIAAASK